MKLYKRSLNKKILVWEIYESARGISIERGYLGGSSILEPITVTMKTANAEINSRIKKKRREGYKSIEELCSLKNIINSNITESQIEYLLPISNLDLNYNLKPAKCRKFVDVKKRKYPMAGQPKLNGIRCVNRVEITTIGSGIFAEQHEGVKLRSMEGLEYVVPHIIDASAGLMFQDEIALDGELYIHGYALNEINAAIPKMYDSGLGKCGRPDLTPSLKFCCFDLSIPDIPQDERLDMSNKLLNPFNKVFDFNFVNSNAAIVKVPSKLIFSDEQAYDFAKECVAHGFEGAVFRDLHAEYKFGSRATTMQKLKFFEDGEFEIIDVVPKDGMPNLGMFICRNDINDNTFTVVSMGSFGYQEKLLTNKEDFIGEMVTVKYYERSGVTNCPFHANALIIRDYEQY